MAGERIRILHTESSLGWGGQEIRILTEARGVAARGHDVTIAAPAESRIFQEAPRFGVDAIAIPVARKSIAGLFAMARLLRSREFDVINVHSSTDSWLAAVAVRLLRRAPPIVRTRHISAPVPRNLATRWLYGTASRRIVTTGERLRLQVIEETGVDPARVISIPTGIDINLFRPGAAAAARTALGLAVDGPAIGIVATLRSWKGHHHLFHAFTGLADHSTRLVVVGDGPQRAALEALAKELRIDNRVLFTGNQTNVVPWLQAFDLFCLPSYANEGVPQALMQAMSCGLPVITTPVGSIAEIVQDGDTGLLVPPEDPTALRAAIERLLGDAHLRARLGTRAREAALQRFGEEQMVDRMLEVFTALARASQRNFRS